MGVFFLFVASLIVGLTNLPAQLAKSAEPIHKICANRFNKSPQREFHSAIVCGSDLTSQTLYDAFRRTGLIHLIVVSGSHLIWIEYALLIFLARFPRGNWLIYILLVIFA